MTSLTIKIGKLAVYKVAVLGFLFAPNSYRGEEKTSYARCFVPTCRDETTLYSLEFGLYGRTLISVCP